MPKKYYYYQYWSNQTGEMKERPLTKQQLIAGDYDPTQVSVSSIPPKERLRKRELYEAGLLGLSEKTGGDYVAAVNWGKLGGRPVKWKNESERKKVFRIKRKVAHNKPLRNSEQELLSSLGFNTNDWNSSYSHSNPRPGAYTYHNDRPASSYERVQRHRGQDLTK